MTDSYVVAGYAITVGSLALYAMRVLRRGRVLARSLPGDVPLAGPNGPVSGAAPVPPPAGPAGDG